MLDPRKNVLLDLVAMSGLRPSVIVLVGPPTADAPEGGTHHQYDGKLARAGFASVECLTEVARSIEAEGA